MKKLSVSEANQPWENVVKLRGVPYKCTSDRIRQFLRELDIPAHGVVMVTDARGRNTGEAFVQLKSHEHAEQALLKHKECIDRRYIEVFKATKAEMSQASQRLHNQCNGDHYGQRNSSLKGVGLDGVYRHVVQMRGLPFRATEEQVRSFFGPDFEISAVQFEIGADHRPTGRASVAFATHEDAEKAMKKDKECMGKRYIELMMFSSQNTPIDGIGPNGEYLYMIHMRGLPFRVQARDIVSFFDPIPILDIHLEMGPKGPTGAGQVAFFSVQERSDALKRDKENIGDRYIELFAIKPLPSAHSRSQQQPHYSIPQAIGRHY